MGIQIGECRAQLFKPLRRAQALFYCWQWLLAVAQQFYDNLVDSCLDGQFKAWLLAVCFLDDGFDRSCQGLVFFNLVLKKQLVFQQWSQLRGLL